MCPVHIMVGPTFFALAIRPLHYHNRDNSHLLLTSFHLLKLCLMLQAYVILTNCLLVVSSDLSSPLFHQLTQTLNGCKALEVKTRSYNEYRF